MEYATFVARGDPEWRRADELYARLRRDGPRALDHAELERLASLHRRVVTDLAFSRTHFPLTAATRRLSALAFTGHRVLARAEAPVLVRLWRFFAKDYPAVFRACAPTIAAAVAIFAGATLLGLVLTLVREDVAGLFLSPDTIEKVRHGELWTDRVTSVIPGSAISGAIATNNISVALFAWGGGALLGLGSLYVLGLNGIMLGSLFALTWQYGLHGKLGVFISAHGPLELTLIIVSAAAGLELARGALATDDLPRRESFAAGAGRSVRLALGTVPWFALLGIVEGYLSPARDVPFAVKALAGLALWGAFLAWALSGARARVRPGGAAP